MLEQGDSFRPFSWNPLSRIQFQYIQFYFILLYYYFSKKKTLKKRARNLVPFYAEALEISSKIDTAHQIVKKDNTSISRIQRCIQNVSREQTCATTICSLDISDCDAESDGSLDLGKIKLRSKKRFSSLLRNMLFWLEWKSSYEEDRERDQSTQPSSTRIEREVEHTASE